MVNAYSFHSNNIPYHTLKDLHYPVSLTTDTGGVMVSMLTLSGVDCESQSGKKKNNEIGISSISTKHAALRRKSKDWLALKSG